MEAPWSAKSRLIGSLQQVERLRNQTRGGEQ